VSRVVLLLSLICLPSCGDGPGTVVNPAVVNPAPDFSAGQDLSAEITPWRHGKQSALTLAFDDNLGSHHVVVAPELERRGLRGTFALNSGRIGQGEWTPWIRLAERGHELANHGLTHARLPELSLEEARAEIEDGRTDLLANVACIDDIVTFVYPYAHTNPDLGQIVMEAHLGARADGVCNPPTPYDYSLIGASSATDFTTLESELDECRRAGGWRIHYFHSIRPTHTGDAYFHTYISYVASLRDSLWVAPQGEITKYTIARDLCHVTIHGQNPGMLTVASDESLERLDVPLTVRIQVLSETVDALVVDGVIISLGSNRTVMVEIAPGDSVEVLGGLLSAGIRLLSEHGLDPAPSGRHRRWGIAPNIECANQFSARTVLRQAGGIAGERIVALGSWGMRATESNATSSSHEQVPTTTECAVAPYDASLNGRGGTCRTTNPATLLPRAVADNRASRDDRSRLVAPYSGSTGPMVPRDQAADNLRPRGGNTVDPTRLVAHDPAASDDRRGGRTENPTSNATRAVPLDVASGDPWTGARHRAHSATHSGDSSVTASNVVENPTLLDGRRG
jgi:peptidoglycan/xylan/chitin deacetylase (PgdA/CDA1 family)